jgi:uncharacterized protein (TIGR02118 family)
MYKLVVLYRKPEVSLKEFEAKYAEHRAMIAKVPGLLKEEVSRFTEAPWGQPDLFQLAELYFADKRALDAALHSPEMGAAGQQLRTYAKGLFTMYYAEVKVAAQ